MGHSYGCSTVIQAYHGLEPQARSQVSHIVLLDPWLFPLTEELFSKPFECPVLILANQNFTAMQDMYERNHKFVEMHRDHTVYICWRGGDHLHQTDMPFITGNAMRKIKNADQCWEQMARNL
jgi:hypothetical protein